MKYIIYCEVLNENKVEKFTFYHYHAMVNILSYLFDFSRLLSRLSETVNDWYWLTKDNHL